MKEPEVVLSKPMQDWTKEYNPPVIKWEMSSANCDKVIILVVPNMIKCHNAKVNTKPIDVVKEH